MISAMWKKLIAASGVFLCSSMHAEEKARESFFYLKTTKPSSFSFGIDVFDLVLNGRIHSGSETIKVKGHQVFKGLDLSYEYRKPEQVYANVNFLLALGSSAYSAFQNNKEITRDEEDSSCFVSGDLHLGYTFSYETFFLTPVIGTGTYIFTDTSYFEWALYYFTGGALFLFSRSDLFDIGTNVKLFYMPHKLNSFEQGLIEVRDWHDAWGAEFSVPFIWGVRESLGWSLHLEPFARAFSVRTLELAYGARFLLNFNF